jgi:alpha/beta superfamily hydrolase
MSTGPTTIATNDGIALEARWDAADDPLVAAVLCHPHPLYGGTMEVPLLRTVAGRLVAAGGRAAVADLAAAVDTATAAFPGLPLALAGWSFGAVIALCWQTDTGSRHRLAAIAPPTRVEVSPGLPDPASLAPAPRLFVIGSRDQFTDVETLGAYAGALGAELRVIPGSDHFFYAREKQVGDAVAAHLVVGSRS